MRWLRASRSTWFRLCRARWKGREKKKEDDLCEINMKYACVAVKRKFLRVSHPEPGPRNYSSTFSKLKIPRVYSNKESLKSGYFYSSMDLNGISGMLFQGELAGLENLLYLFLSCIAISRVYPPVKLQYESRNHIRILEPLTSGQPVQDVIYPQLHGVYGPGIDLCGATRTVYHTETQEHALLSTPVEHLHA